MAHAVFDPNSHAFARDPYPAYTALRSVAGFSYFEPFDTHLVARFDDVSLLVKDRRLVRTLEAFYPAERIAEQKRRDNWHDMPFHSRFVQFSMLDSDGDVHDRLRQQVFQFFGPAPIAHLRAKLEPQIEVWVNEAVASQTFDFVADLAAKIPGYTIGTLMGVPPADCEQIRQWSEQIVQYFDVDRRVERKLLAESTTQTFYEYLQELVEHRRRLSEGRRPDDLLTKLIAVEAAGLISHDELYSTCMLIVMAGHGSTLDVMGSGMQALIQFPAEQESLRNDSGLIKTALPEMFRFDSPLPFFHRYAAEDIEIGGVNYSQGTRFGLLYGSANRDPVAFEQPDQFFVKRFPNRHLAFGGGAHFCLGNHLARLSMDILFSRLLASTKSIHAAGEPEYKTGLSARGPVALPIRCN